MRRSRFSLALLTAMFVAVAAAAAQDGFGRPRPERHGPPRPATRPAKAAATRPVESARYTADGTTAALVRHTYAAAPGDVAAVLVAHHGTLVLVDPTLTGAGLRAESDGAMTVLGGMVATTAPHAPAAVADGGTITLTGGMLATAGAASPAVRARGKVIATDVVASAAAAEAVVIEGSHSATFTRCTLTGNSDCGVLIARSDSDARPGRAYFTLTGGLLTTGRGPAVRVTNQTATIQLTDTAISARGGVLLDVVGGHVTLKAIHQTLVGDLTVNSVGTADVSLTGGSTLTGAVTRAVLTIAADSKWVVNGDSTVTALVDADAVAGHTVANIVGNGHAVHYDAATTANAWLKGKTYDLVAGGKLSPAE